MNLRKTHFQYANFQSLSPLHASLRHDDARYVPYADE